MHHIVVIIIVKVQVLIGRPLLHLPDGKQPHPQPTTNPRPTTVPPSHLPSLLSVVSDSQHHHRISGIFKGYLFMGKPRENPHHVQRATGMGNSGGGDDGGESCWSWPTKVNLALQRRTPSWDSVSLLSSSRDL